MGGIRPGSGQELAQPLLPEALPEQMRLVLALARQGTSFRTGYPTVLAALDLSLMATMYRRSFTI